MRKKFLIAIVGLFIVGPTIIKADVNSSVTEAQKGCYGSNTCWSTVGSIDGEKKWALRAVRATIFNENAERVSDSIDISLNDGIRNFGVIRNNSNLTKIEYMNGASLNWSSGNMDNVYILPQDFAGRILKQSISSNKSVQEIVATYFEEHKGFVTIPELKDAVQLCSEKYRSKCNTKHYYAVFEPVTVIRVGTNFYYGTSYELANSFYVTDILNYHIRQRLPNFLYIVGEFPDFYRKAGLRSLNGDYNLHDKRIGENYTYDELMHFGVGISVYDWTENVPNDTILPLREEITCDVNVNITECGEASVTEASNNRKDCIVNNAAYSYIDACNLYCSDQIITDFSGFYNNFIGNNTFGAIKSGKYLAIKSNPKITIKKTCYQSKSSNECSDVSSSFNDQLKKDYKTNKIYLTVDGKKYEFIGNSTITNDGYSSATITYEYKLDENINKYINIETMKGVLNPSDKTYTNDGPTIITSKGSYGTYTYNFDVSETPINKYNVSSSAVRDLMNLKNTSSDKYEYENKLNVTYTNTKNNQKDNYTLDDLKNNSCTYVKYNTDEGCIGAENQCVDSVTCEVLDSCDVCECTGKYGCLDDGKCTPITDPKTDGDGKDVCDPEQKTCFPNLIYRPISLVEPFPGVDGKTRTPGNNWNKIYKTSDGRVYSYGDYYIRQRRGYKDYEIYQADPLYVIRLDGNKIQAIRMYNKTHNYNDFDLKCINGENCISNFLRGKANGFTINLIDSGTCKDITNHNFDSCIKNKGE